VDQNHSPEVSTRPAFAAVSALTLPIGAAPPRALSRERGPGWLTVGYGSAGARATTGLRSTEPRLRFRECDARAKAGFSINGAALEKTRLMNGGYPARLFFGSLDRVS
jgi:hypothetical protein